MHSAFDTLDVVERRRSDVATAEAKYRKLSSELQELDLKRKDVQEHLDVLQDEIESHRTALAVRVHPRIPAEIFSEILQYCCGTDKLNVFHGKGQLQWILSAVCRRWRAIAFSTPQLWSSLHFDVAYAIRNHFRDTVDIARQILKRSGQVPLAITLDMGANRHHLLRALLKESFRWKSFRLGLQPHKSNGKTVAMLNDQRGNFPMLEALAVKMASKLPAPLTAFETCPTLHSLELSLRAPARDVAVPWGRITSFSGSLCLSNDDPLRLMRNMPAVRHAVINLADSESRIDAPREPNLLPHLRSLHLHGSSRFIQYAILPALTELSMERCPLLGEHYTSLFSQVGGSLTTLELIYLPNGPEINLSTFKHLTRLERLEILSRSDIDSSFYNGMTATERGAVILPNLRILHLWYRITITPPLLAMLDSRIFRHINDGASGKYRSTAVLERVFIGYKAVTDDLHDRMSALQVHGNGTHIEFVEGNDSIMACHSKFEALRSRLSTRYGSSTFYRS
ncbi:hypothetical protein HGRIS_000195 [Hohenbuehelia grisea]|uniref:F-box domain-containing protein n=1 Tax=Hohenbuehelia grisea TaxID=104357 RepID=A0ABR3JRI2_9AGAR